MRQFIGTGGVLLGLLLAACSFALPAGAQTAMVTVHVRPQPLANALLDFAMQAGLSINESGVDFHQAASNAVDGTFTQEDALKRLLAGTGYAFQFVASDAVQIKIAKAQTHPPRPSIMENVVVTATKRAEVAQSLPYSIAVAQGQQLSDMGVESVTGLTTYVAGLTTTNIGAGEDKLFVRGLTDSVLPGLSESVVGLYLDETRIADDAPDPNLQLIDVDRVEVLRGPQGSLYGAGSLTGLVRIITRRPEYGSFDAAAGASIATTAGGELSTSFNAMLNLPLSRDDLALRLVAYTDKTSGYVDDVPLHAKNTNSTTIKGGRGMLGWKPDGIWTVTANATFQETKARDSQYYLEDLGPDNRDNLLREPHYDRLFVSGVTAEADFNGVDLVSNTSFLDRRLKVRFDASQAWNGLTGFPIGPSPFDFARSIIAFTHETRLSSATDGKWEWLSGLFLAWRSEDFNSDLSGPDNSGTTIIARLESQEVRTREAALFGEVTYRFTPDFSLIAGARAFYADHSVSAKRSGLLITSDPSFSGTSSESGLAPKIVLSYQPSAAATFYVQFSQGYRLGGLNVDGPPDATEESRRSFDPDSIQNYEAGSKLDLFSGHLVANSAIYYVRWRNVQTDQIASNGAFFILNAGDVSDLGAEIDLAARPLEHLELQAHAFWNNADLSHRNPLLDADGEGLPGAPHTSMGFSARYDIPVAREDTAFLAGSFDYVGPSHLGFGENTPTMGNYRLVNLRLGWMHGSWQAILYADNVLNDVQNTFAFGNPFDAGIARQITPPRPRTIGITLSWTR